MASAARSATSLGLPLALALASSAAITVHALDPEVSPPVSPSPIPSAPPNPPTVWASPSDFPASRPAALAAGSPYSIGEPTDEEQLYVELINRSRANPQAEALLFINTTDPDILAAYRQFQVDLNLLSTQYAAIAPAPPVSIHPALTDAARIHSLDMFQNEFQEHRGSDGSTPSTRLNRVGYAFLTTAENIFAYAKNVWQGHAGFEVDWGNGPGGMQTPPGHRNTIHNAAFREIGVGVVLGTKGKVGPQLVTQEFASGFNATPFITGVVFFDFNGNQFYDLGEGIGGVTVRAEGVPSHAVTARSGGYSIPVPANGTYTLTFLVPGSDPVSRPVTVSNLQNVKADWLPPYTPPQPAGPTVAAVGVDHPYSLPAVPAATAYEWRPVELSPWSTPEGAENQVTLFAQDVSSGYAALATDIRKSGARSFRFAHPAPLRNQFLTITQPFQVGPNSTLSFWSRLTLATTGQIARAQVSTNAGADWTDVWTQPGSGNSGESAFSRRSVDLGAYRGHSLLLRFAYTITPGQSGFTGTSSGVGWYLDDILVSEAEFLNAEDAQPTTGTSFVFRPPTEGEYLLQTRARIGDRLLPWSPALRVTAQTGVAEPPRIRLGALSPRPDGAWDLAFRVEQGSAASFVVEKANAVSGPWTPDPAAVIEAAGAPPDYRARIPSQASPAGFLRIMAK